MMGTYGLDRERLSRSYGCFCRFRNSLWLGWRGCRGRVKKFRTLRKNICSNHIPNKFSPPPILHPLTTTSPHTHIPQSSFIMYVLSVPLQFLHYLIHMFNFVSIGSLSVASPSGPPVKHPSLAAFVHCRRRSSPALSPFPTVAHIISLSSDRLSPCCRFVTTQLLNSLDLLLPKTMTSSPTLSIRALMVVNCLQQKWFILGTSNSMLPRRPWVRSSRSLVTFWEQKLSMIRGV